MITRTSFILLFLFTGVSFSCSSDTPATPEQRAKIVEVVDSATSYLQNSKRFLRLPEATVPKLDTGADYFIANEVELKLVSPDILVTIQGDSAEVLIGLKNIQDSLSSEHRDAMVQMIRDSGVWKGNGVYIVE